MCLQTKERERPVIEHKFEVVEKAVEDVLLYTKEKEKRPAVEHEFECAEKAGAVLRRGRAGVGRLGQECRPKGLDVPKHLNHHVEEAVVLASAVLHAPNRPRCRWNGRSW